MSRGEREGQGSRPAFDYSLDYSSLNLRERPDLYRIGKGEQGVLLVEPYKSEILPHWRFRTPEVARESSETIYRMFEDYLAVDDFPGADMARKFLQMGWTRARRYANHRSGRKWDTGRTTVLPPETDAEKAESAAIFKDRWDAARADARYRQLRTRHLALLARVRAG